MVITAHYVRPRRATRFGAHLVLLVTFGLGFALSLINHHSADCSPWHDHIVIGGDARAQAQALASHHHACAWTQTPDPAPEHTFGPYSDEQRVTNAPRIISITSLTAAGALLFTTGEHGLLAPTGDMLLPALLCAERFFPRAYFLLEIDYLFLIHHRAEPSKLLRLICCSAPTRCRLVNYSSRVSESGRLT